MIFFTQNKIKNKWCLNKLTNTDEGIIKCFYFIKNKMHTLYIKLTNTNSVVLQQ